MERGGAVVTRAFTIAVVLLCAADVAGQQARGPATVVGNWRGMASTPTGDTESVILTVSMNDGAYAGFVSGLIGNDVSLTAVTVEGGQLTAEASVDTDLGRVAVRYELTLNEDGDVLSGSQHVGLGALTAPFDLELKRGRRRDVPQPQVEQRPGYFVGTWEFDYTGGEFPPLSLGTRTGRVTFTQRGAAPFIDGVVTGEVFGERYTEQIVIGYDETRDFLVFKDTLSNGVELLSVADWTSPIAIGFVTSPVEADGHVHQLRRVISVTSETAFRVTEEFSVDGGPFQRLGNGTFKRLD